MSELIPAPRQPFNFTEEPDWKLEARSNDLAIAEACGQRQEQIDRELGHIAFELDQRHAKDETVIV